MIRPTTEATPRLKLDHTRPDLATIDGRTVTKRPRACRSCGVSIEVVEEGRNQSDADDRSNSYKALATFPGPAEKCFKCRFEDLIIGEAWLSGGSTHEDLRTAIAAFEGASRPAELQAAAELKARLESLGDDGDFLFPVGTLRLGKITAQSGVGPPQIKPFLDRHVRGDFGYFGQMPATTPTEAAWWPDLAEVAQQNRIAIERKSGFVRSAYEPTTHIHPGQQREITSQVRILTFIDGDSAQTLAIAEGRSSVSL